MLHYLLVLVSKTSNQGWLLFLFTNLASDSASDSYSRIHFQEFEYESGAERMEHEFAAEPIIKEVLSDDS